MSMYALFLNHRTKSGRRDDVERVWRRHMMLAVEHNPGHVAYIYAFGDDPDTICAFQVYRSREEADAFLRTDAYVAYIEESRPLLENEPEVTILLPRWVKDS